MVRWLAILVVLAIGAVGALGCGDDDEGSETPATTATKESGGTGSAADDSKADKTAESSARSAQKALESYAAENGGSYKGATPSNLSELEPVGSDVGVQTTADTYSVTADSESGNTFTIERDASGKVTRTCTKSGVGECGEDGDW